MTLTIRQRGVRSILDKSGLDYRVRWDRQPVDMIAKIFKVVSTYMISDTNFFIHVTPGSKEVPIP
jgi:hypothetical protein